MTNQPTPDTRHSLIARLSDRQNVEAWEQFSAIYQPLVYRLGRTKGLQDADAQEVAQEVMVAVSRAVDHWEPEKGRFRDWLFKIARNMTINFLTRPKHRPIGSGDSAIAAVLENQCERASRESSLFHLEYRRAVFHWAARQVKEQSRTKTWTAFWQTTVQSRPVQQVADELEMTVGAVYIARSRTLAKLRAAAADFDQSSPDSEPSENLSNQINGVRHGNK